MAYNFSFTDQDIESIDEQAKAFQKQYKESGERRERESRPRMSFLSEGKYTFRIYPDRDKKGNPRISRRVWTHQGLPIGEKRRAYVWQDKRVDDLVNELQREGVTKLGDNVNIWSCKSRSTHLMCVYIFESNDLTWNPPGSTLVWQLNDRQGFALQNWILDLHPEEKRLFLDPNNDKAPGIRLSIDGKGPKANVSISQAGMRGRPLPMPPKLWDSASEEIFHEFTGLDAIYLNEEEDKLSDEDFEEFRKFAYIELEKFKALNGPSSDTTQKGYKFGNGSGRSAESSDLRVLPKTSGPLDNPSPDTGTKPCPLAAAMKTKKDLKDKFGENVQYGNRPGQINPYCQICDWEDDCQEVTLKNQRAQDLDDAIPEFK
jgi:hypothetical protein